MSQKKLGMVEELLEELLKIPEKKIVTLCISERIFKVDVDESGQFGYQLGVKELFMAKLHRALMEGGCMIIRQFLSIRVKREGPNKEKRWIPEKNLYGVLFKDNQWLGITKDQLQESSEIDHETGEALSPEEGAMISN